jgi:alcohol dehydrogenase class IV
LPHVVCWNRTAAAALYDELAGADLTDRLAALRGTAGLPSRLRDLGVPEQALSVLAEEAASQWTGRFNPRPFDSASALEIYQAAY